MPAGVQRLLFHGHLSVNTRLRAEYPKQTGVACLLGKGEHPSKVKEGPGVGVVRKRRLAGNSRLALVANAGCPHAALDFSCFSDGGMHLVKSRLLVVGLLLSRLPAEARPVFQSGPFTVNP